MKVSKVMQLLSASGGDFARLLDYSATKIQVGFPLLFMRVCFLLCKVVLLTSFQNKNYQVICQLKGAYVTCI